MFSVNYCMCISGTKLGQWLSGFREEGSAIFGCVGTTLKLCEKTDSIDRKMHNVTFSCQRTKLKQFIVRSKIFVVFNSVWKLIK